MNALNPPHTPWSRSTVLGIVLSLVVGVLVLAFSWPAITSEPRALPIVVAGPQEAVAPIAGALAEQADGAFIVTPAEDRVAAVEAIETRTAYGAIVVDGGATPPEVLYSTAASPVAAQLLQAVGAQLQQMVDAQLAAASQATGQQLPAVEVAMTDVVPLLPTDPRGAGITAATFPLVLGGMIGGIALTMAISGVWRRVVALLVYSIAGGLAIVAIMQGWFQALAGDYLLNAAAVGLTLLAIGATIVGFASVVGRAGVAIGPVLFLLIANPIAGATAPKEFLPEPWGAVGQWFPPGAGATLVRDLSYFPAADTTFPWLVLASWAVGGLLLAMVGHFRNAKATEGLETPEPPEDAPAAA
ncbi:MAG: ABC transporter permease [Microbacteriaceae bacterium]|nr:ABC transporter permease [Microbacteriaceae bacterium]